MRLTSTPHFVHLAGLTTLLATPRVTIREIAILQVFLYLRFANIGICKCNPCRIYTKMAGYPRIAEVNTGTPSERLLAGSEAPITQPASKIDSECAAF